MKIARKILTILSIASVVIVGGLLIGALFGLKSFASPFLQVMLCSAIICVASAFSLNALSIYTKKRVLSIVNLALIGVLTVLGLIIVFIDFQMGNLFTQITVILAMTTILFNIIVSNYSKLERNQMVLQIVTYTLIGLIDVLLTMQILGVDLFALEWFLKVFVVLCLVAFIALCTLSILGKRILQKDEHKTETNTVARQGSFIKIAKKDYDAMLTKISKLEEELKKLKEEKEI